MLNESRQILCEMKQLASPEKAKVLQRFFKTGPGDYGEGDVFLGVMNPQTRSVAAKHKLLSPDACEELLASEFHEVRLCALLILARQYKKSRAPELLKLYLKAAATGRVNNWDLVDLSAPDIAGVHALENGPDLLYALAAKQSLWEQRIGIVGSLTLIRNGELDATFQLVRQLMDHPHDLIHKACGWMLRETGKRNHDKLFSFLCEYRNTLPRTALRYAIERFPESERRFFLKKV